MKLDPGFSNHWKTELLIEQLGGDGVVALLRLWGNAQIRREFSGLELTPKRLAMETKWRGDAQRLFDVFTDPDAPWLDKAEDGTFTIHGFAEWQHQIVKLWDHGKLGGRPQKVSPAPPSKAESSSGTLSSSYPICEPNGNHMVFDGNTKTGKSKAKGTLNELKSFAEEIGLPSSDGENCFHKWESTGWRDIRDWRAKMRTWKLEGFHASQKTTGLKHLPTKPTVNTGRRTNTIEEV